MATCRLHGERKGPSDWSQVAGKPASVGRAVCSINAWRFFATTPSRDTTHLRGIPAARDQSAGSPHTPHTLYFALPPKGSLGGVPRGFCLPPRPGRASRERLQRPEKEVNTVQKKEVRRRLKSNGFRAGTSPSPSLTFFNRCHGCPLPPPPPLLLRQHRQRHGHHLAYVKSLTLMQRLSLPQSLLSQSSSPPHGTPQPPLFRSHAYRSRSLPRTRRALRVSNNGLTTGTS